MALMGNVPPVLIARKLFPTITKLYIQDGKPEHTIRGRGTHTFLMRWHSCSASDLRSILASIFPQFPLPVTKSWVPTKPPWRTPHSGAREELMMALSERPQSSPQTAGLRASARTPWRWASVPPNGRLQIAGV